MNISWIKKHLFIFVFLPVFCFAQSYAAFYPKECEVAQRFFTEHQQQFEQAGGSLGLSAKFLFAVVAPEITQFSHLSNKLETYSLKVLYVQAGQSYSDFSIGYFQMKPSFIERLEDYAAADTILKTKYAACLFANPNERASRVARVDRLNMVEWQITYLTLFCEVVQKQFGNVLFTTKEEQLRFYASAYNCGFQNSEQQIKETEQKALFPHFLRKKFKYSDIAVWFYHSCEE